MVEIISIQDDTELLAIKIKNFIDKGYSLIGFSQSPVIINGFAHINYTAVMYNNLKEK